MVYLAPFFSDLISSSQNHNCFALQKFYQGLSVALRSWIGVVHEVLFRVTLKLKNGARLALFYSYSVLGFIFHFVVNYTIDLM